MALNRAFGMLIEKAAAFTRPAGSVLLMGPMIGLSPEPGQPLILRGAFGRPQRARCAGIVQFHRGEVPGQVGVVVTGLDGATPAYYRGGILHEEGVLCRTFGALQRSRSQRQIRAAARFDLREDRAFGFIALAGGVLDAFVIGGGLPEGENLWSLLERMVTPEGQMIELEALRPLGPGWPVSGWQGYMQAEHTIILTRPCGPAEPGHPILISQDDEAMEAAVLAQQVQGVVQIDVARAIPLAPSFLIADSSVAFSGCYQAS